MSWEKSMPQQFDVFVANAPQDLTTHWFWLVALGVGVALLGLLAMWRARAATVVSVQALGAILCVAAFSILAFAFLTTGFWTQFFVNVLWAALIGMTGVVLMTQPRSGAESITLLMSFYFLVTGFGAIGFALTSHIQGESLHALNGAISLILGFLLLLGWPLTGLWAVGVFVGVDLLMRGVSIAALGLLLRDAAM
jgi:uncharacterized membrane protein HdeD (DUF308 family)